MMSVPPVSLTLIAWDEESHVEGCQQSLSGLDATMIVMAVAHQVGHGK